LLGLAPSEVAYSTTLASLARFHRVAQGMMEKVKEGGRQLSNLEMWWILSPHDVCVGWLGLNGTFNTI